MPGVLIYTKEENLSIMVVSNTLISLSSRDKRGEIWRDHYIYRTVLHACIEVELITSLFLFFFCLANRGVL